MKSWRVIQAGIVTPKGNESTLDAPAVLLEHFAPFVGNQPPMVAPFDRSAPLDQAAYRSCRQFTRRWNKR